MGLRSDVITPRGGTFYTHLFENPERGVARGLYWCVAVDFEPLRYLDEDWDTAAAIDWLQFDRLHTPLVQSVHASAASQPNAEASFYLAEHWPSDDWAIRMQPVTESPRWILEFDLLVEFGGLDDDLVPDLRLSGATDLKFNGIVVVRSNVSPKPNSAQEAASLLAEFMELDSSYGCRDEGWRYVFHRR